MCRMSKYHSKRVTRADGLSFDSQAEAARYAELELLEAVGHIINLQLHPRLPICPAFERQGKYSRPRYYYPDFSYRETKFPHAYVVEDVKGGKATQTALWSLKWALAQFLNPDYEFRVVER